MTVLERIKALCREKKNISITVLEQELGYSNGSLAKAKDIPSSRIMEIANYLGVSMDYLMVGRTNSIVETVKTDVELSLMEDRLKAYALKLAKLPKDKQVQIMSLIDMLEDK